MEKYMRKFFLYTLALFILFIGVIGLFLFVLDMPLIGNALQVVGAWSSTFVFLAMFKKIYPGASLFSYIKKQFAGKIKTRDIIASLCFFLFAWFGTALIVSLAQSKSIFDVLIISPGFMLISFFTCLIRGPLGEELGWRAFLLNELECKYGFTKAAVLNGLLWGIWHIPLILVSGYTAIETLVQIACNIIALIALVFVMAALYRQSKNLLMPILTHQFFNYALILIADDSIVSNIAITVCTVIVAIIYWPIYAKKRRSKSE